MSGFVGDLSTQQNEALGLLRSAVADIPVLVDKDDYYFLRWLRARKFNLKEAEDMLRKHIALRKKYSLDTILTDYTPPEVLRKYFPGGAMGEDRDGHPVWYDSFNHDFRGLHRSVKLDDIIKFCLYRLELCVKLCEKMSAQKGQHIETITLVVNYEELSLQRHYYWPGIHMIKTILSICEANYPEFTKRAFLINTPLFFPWGYNIIKQVLDEATRSKIFVFGSDYHETLHQYISPDQLPQAYGGNRCEPDPYCTQYINPGGIVPEEYYLANLMESARDEMERVVIGRASCHEIPFQVDLPGSTLTWEFMTTDHDISFGWYFKPEKSSNNIEVRPMKRKKSHIIPESGFHICEHAGKYIMKFDNSYSWTRSKEVFYSVKVLPPDTEGFKASTQAVSTHTLGE